MESVKICVNGSARCNGKLYCSPCWMEMFRAQVKTDLAVHDAQWPDADEILESMMISELARLECLSIALDRAIQW